MSGPALWTGDRVRGFNPHISEVISGELLRLEVSEMDRKTYAIVKTSLGEAVIEATLLDGPRVCRRPQPRGEWGEDQVTCANCGRRIYANGPYDSDRLTHNLDRVPPRYR